MPEKPIVTEIAVKNQQTSEYEYADIGSSADKITYDNSSSQLEGGTVQAAIDEVNTKIGNKSTVSVTPTLVSGTQVGTISVNGTGINLYAPTPIDVVANPSASGELDNLQQVTIGSTSYNVPQGNSNVEELDDLSDVSISNPSSGDVLTYNGTEWHAAPAQGGGGSSTLSGLSDVDLSSLVDGQILKYDATNQEWINANESTGSTVVWNQIQSTGTKIATVSVDGTPTDVYAPTSGGGGGGATSLAGLDDVTISSASNDQDLSYDSTSSKWINKTHRVELTKAQYDALPSSKLTDGIEYFITDMETTGVEIVANPEDTATGTLTKLQIGDEVYNISGGSSSGHTILDNDGTALTQRDELQFIGAYINDDNTNEITKVNIVREMTKAQFDLLSNDEKVGLIRVTDEADGIGNGYKETVLYDGSSASSLQSSVELSETWNNFNAISFEWVIGGDNSIMSNLYAISVLEEMVTNSRNYLCTGYTDIYAIFKLNSDKKTLTNITGSRVNKLLKVIGINFGGGNSSSSLNYSTNEQKTGQKWIDGSDIYQKTYVITSSDVTFSSYTTYNHGIANFGKVLNYSGYVTYPTDFRTFPSITNNSSAYNIGLADYTSTQFGFSFGGSTTSNIVNLTFTVQYTKTT